MIATECETVKVEPVESDLLADVVNRTIDGLSVVERAKFENLDLVVVDGREAFIRVGNALAQIRDGRLYRATHGTFEAYLVDRGYGRQRAYALIEAAEVATSLSEISDIPITTESHAAALAQVPAADRAVVLKVASESTGGKITAQAIKKESGRQRQLRELREQRHASKAKLSNTLGITVEQIEQAEFIKSKSPELTAKCEAGEITLDQAGEQIEASTGCCEKSPDGQHAWDTDRDGTKFCTACCEDFDPKYHGAIPHSTKKPSASVAMKSASVKLTDQEKREVREQVSDLLNDLRMCSRRVHRISGAFGLPDEALIQVRETLGQLQQFVEQHQRSWLSRKNKTEAGQ
jgi:hypothetical protein